MGEARRRKLAGYVPEPKQEIQPQKGRKAVIVLDGIGAMAMVSAMLADYPKLPEEVLKGLRRYPASLDSICSATAAAVTGLRRTDE